MSDKERLKKVFAVDRVSPCFFSLAAFNLPFDGSGSGAQARVLATERKRERKGKAREANTVV